MAVVLRWLVYLLKLSFTCCAIIGFSAKVINLFGIIFSSIITLVQPVSNNAYVFIKKSSFLIVHSIWGAFISPNLLHISIGWIITLEFSSFINSSGISPNFFFPIYFSNFVTKLLYPSFIRTISCSIIFIFSSTERVFIIS